MHEQAPPPPLPSSPSEGEGVSSPLSPDVWVPALRRVIPRTRLLRVPAGSAFLPYLLDDAVVVPGGDDDSRALQPGDDVFSEEALAASRTAGSPGSSSGGGNGGVPNGGLANGVAGHHRIGGGTSSSSSSGIGDGDDSNSDGDPSPPPVACPPDVIAAITAALVDLGTDVSPKFGGRCPTDAGWVSFHRSPRSSTAADVLLLFKSSERVAVAVADAVAAASSSSSSEATAAAAGPQPPLWLLLRAWMDMSAGVEVRAFVAAGRVVALCTRGDAGEGGGGGLSGGGGGGGLLATEDGKRQVVAAVEHLWATTVAAALRVDALVLDVYVDESGRGWVVDVAPAGEAAGVDALLFTWAELRTMTAAAAEAAAIGDGEWHPWLRCAAEGGDAPPLVPSRALYDGVPLELRQPGSAAALVAAATDMVNREREDAQRGQ